MDDQQPTLRVRINHIDYNVVPAGELDNTSLPRAPIIRIFGESSTGQKTCVHVHQVYPYFFVEYGGKMDPDDVVRYISRLTRAINHAMALSMKRHPNSPNSRFVRAIVLVKGVHFYGFHSNYSPFLKIHIADPHFVNRAITILRSGTIMKTRFRIYEGHLSFMLQFMSDFGLYGCGWIDLGEVWQRGQDDAEHEDQHNAPVWIAQQIGRLPVSPYYKQTRMQLELDVHAHQILNRYRMGARDIHHELSIPAPPLSDDPVVPSVRELWEDERRRRIARGLSPSPNVSKGINEDSRRPRGEWVAEAMLWDNIRERIEKERGQDVSRDIGREWERWVMTVFESAEALWEPHRRTWRPVKLYTNVETEKSAESETNPYSVIAPDEMHGQEPRKPVSERDIDVDEDMLTSQEISRFIEREELEFDGPGPEINDGQDENKDETIEEGFEHAFEDVETTPRKSADDQTKYDILTASQVSPSKRPISFGQAWYSSVRTTSSLPTNGGERSPRSTPTEAVGMNIPISTSGPVVDLSSENPFIDRDDVFMPASNETVHVERAETDPGAITPSLPASIALSTTAFKRDSLADDELGHSPRKRPKLDSSACTTRHLAQTQMTPRPRPTRRPDPRPTPINPKNCLTYTISPPPAGEMVLTLEQHGLPDKLYQRPYYSNPNDAPEFLREFAGLVYDLRSGTEFERGDTDDLAEFDPLQQVSDGACSDVYGWEYAGAPPTRQAVRRWLNKKRKKFVGISQRTTQSSTTPRARKRTLKAQPPMKASITREKGSMSALSVEAFAPSRGQHLPDPGIDEVAVIFYGFYNSNLQRQDQNTPFICTTGIIALKGFELSRSRIRRRIVEYVDTELDLINRLVDIVHDLDPDILTGWDVQTSSWGFINARARTFDFDFEDLVSRAPNCAVVNGVDQWGLRTTSTFKVVGRHVLNMWRIMRVELALSSYTFENVVFHVLRRRTPRYTARTLTEWYDSDVPEQTFRLINHFIARISMVLEIIEVAEIITKNAEFARVFGVDFFSVLSRGSQFKVESFMFRIAKPESFVLLSPSREDVGKQNAAECMPLIMEPISAFYSSPLVVLDFQSLYPSVMIAYNYCYSTCLGRVTEFMGQNKFGVTELHQPAGLLDTLKDHIQVSPNGMIFVKPEVRKGLLGRMLTELLDTRVMVKHAMKEVKDDKTLLRVLQARQLSLKFIANVTYGYTSATFSGRMPAVEIADAIVQTGRETLEKAIRTIDGTKKWGAKVVYGDTDSLFIYLKGKTKEQAFRIGHEIANDITSMNPAPVKLKFEKVYLPCVLMAKKRYVGYKFENPDDTEAAFDAKGIETVRRDGIPLQQSMVEHCLKILFKTQDLSRIKDYCCSVWSQILDENVSVQDFIFAKEVKLGTYSDTVPPPPGVAVAARRMLEDPNDEPQYGERVPYVITRGAPGTRLVDRAVGPEVLLNDHHEHLDALYYISRVLIPPLERIFNLVGADIRSWYDEMAKPLRLDEAEAIILSPRKLREQTTLADRLQIQEHFCASECLVCGALAYEELCYACCARPQESIGRMLTQLQANETQMRDAHLMCASCSSTPQSEPIQCESLDCPWLFERKRLENRIAAFDEITDILEEMIMPEDEMPNDTVD